MAVEESRVKAIVSYHQKEVFFLYNIKILCLSFQGALFVSTSQALSLSIIVYNFTIDKDKPPYLRIFKDQLCVIGDIALWLSKLLDNHDPSVEKISSERMNSD